MAQGTDTKQPAEGILDLRALLCGAHTSGFALHIAISETLLTTQLIACKTGAEPKINARSPRAVQ